MFIEITEMKTAIYEYQLEQITEADDDIILQGIEAAIIECEAYLRPSNKKDVMDGRPRYDVDAIFSATGTSRNALLMQYTKNIAVWHIITLCNVDMIYENAKDRYDRAIDFLKKLNKGETVLKLPLLQDEDTTPQQPFRSGSRIKFNHE